jgi:DNA modification methylase
MTNTQLKLVQISKIKVENRYRKDMGNLDSLAKSIKENGLLQPIGITKKYDLIFGERRLRAIRDLLKKTSILCRVIDLDNLIVAENDENEIRKDFTPSEKVAIGKEIERMLGNRQGQRSDKHVEKIPYVEIGKTRDIAAKKAGFANDKTYRQAKSVVNAGSVKLIQAMDEAKVSISAASILSGISKKKQNAVISLDKKAILRVAKEIKQKNLQDKIEFFKKKLQLPAQKEVNNWGKKLVIFHGDAVNELKKIPSNSVDLIFSDPPYPCINREYGNYSESSWLLMMKKVLQESKRILKNNSGSMVFVLQPNFEIVGKMRLWFFEFIAKAARDYGIVQDIWYWATNTIPTGHTNRKHGLLRPSVKMCLWLGPSTCFRRQEAVLWMPTKALMTINIEDRFLRKGPSGVSYNKGRMLEIAEERGGSTPYNLIPLGATSNKTQHPAKTPDELVEWFIRYLMPQNGVVLDPFVGSGTTLRIALKHGASKCFGIEKNVKYIKEYLNK